MEQKKHKTWLWILLLIPVIYLAVQLYSSANKPYYTQTASQVTLSDGIEVTGTVVRTETVISMPADGVISYVVDNVQRVSAGTEVARLFSTVQEAYNDTTARELNAQITTLQNAQQDGVNVGTDVKMVLAQLDSDLYDLIDMSVRGQYAGLADVKSAMGYASNKLAVAVGEMQNFDVQIAALQQEYEACAQAGGAIASIAAPQTGFFFYDVDGYENLTPEAVAAMSAAEVDALPQSPQQPITGTAGKMVDDYKWQFVFTVSETDAKRFSAGQKLTVNFTDAGVTGMQAQVVSVGEIQAGRAKITMECQEMMPELSDLRFENADIIFATYTGIRISQSALHINDEGQRGVYIKYGSLVRFCTITPIFETDTYILVPVKPDASDTTNEVQLFDEIIVEGTDLYDGKLL